MNHRSIADKILLVVTAAAILGLLPSLILSISTQGRTGTIIDIVVMSGISMIFSGV